VRGAQRLMLGNADGRLTSRAFAGAPVTQTITTDVMPDITLPPVACPVTGSGFEPEAFRHRTQLCVWCP
jgi:hypothetical protein